MTHVPYRGGDAAGVGVAAGELQAMVASFDRAPAYKQPHSVSRSARNPAKQLLDIPTIAESGVPARIHRVGRRICPPPHRSPPSSV
jgi:tripartite-type tricarboxylate transporter receptor subunit TctC